MLLDQAKNNWVDVPDLIGGWNTFDEPSNIKDNESPFLSNIVFDGGIVSPRSGNKLLYAKPDGETGFNLQTMVAKTSDGLEYLVAVYANHFYVRHDVNDEWLRINQTYTPVETELFYGYVVWNNGRGDDRLYFCNGVDDFGRWDICVNQTSAAILSGVSVLPVDDATRFPSSGTLVIKGATSTFTIGYSSHTVTSFTLTSPLPQNVPDNASISVDVQQKGIMERGKVLTKSQLRLFSANHYGGETMIKYSVKNDPEDFTPGSGIAAGSTVVIADGNGEITSLDDFGEYLVVSKRDSLHHFQITVSSDLTTKLDVITPILSGKSLGPVSHTSTLKVLSALFYLTENEDFLLIYPQARTYSQTTTSGNAPIGQTGINFDNLVSKNINSYLDSNASFDNCRSTFFDQKLLFAAALKNGTQNTQVLCYDNERNIWTLIKGWAVQDFAVKDSQLLYMDSGSGDIYQAFTGEYHDNNNPYLVEFFTKAFNFGVFSRVKTGSPIYVQGYMTPATDLFIDVLYNEQGLLKKQTFNINKDTPNLYYSQPLTDSLGQPILGVSILSSVVLSEIGDVSTFRCYLGNSNRHGYYNIQLRVYSNKQAFWGITGVGFNTILEAPIPNELIIDPIVIS